MSTFSQVFLPCSLYAPARYVLSSLLFCKGFGRTRFLGSNYLSSVASCGCKVSSARSRVCDVVFGPGPASGMDVHWKPTPPPPLVCLGSGGLLVLGSMRLLGHPLSQVPVSHHHCRVSIFENTVHQFLVVGSPPARVAPNISISAVSVCLSSVHQMHEVGSTPQWVLQAAVKLCLICKWCDLTAVLVGGRSLDFFCHLFGDATPGQLYPCKTLFNVQYIGLGVGSWVLLA